MSFKSTWPVTTRHRHRRNTKKNITLCKLDTTSEPSGPVHPSITAPSRGTVAQSSDSQELLRTLNTPHPFSSALAVIQISDESLTVSNLQPLIGGALLGAGPSVQGRIVSLWPWSCPSGLPLFCTCGTNRVSRRDRAPTDPSVSGRHWRSDAAFRWSWNNPRLWSGRFYPTKLQPKSFLQQIETLVLCWFLLWKNFSICSLGSAGHWTDRQKPWFPTSPECSPSSMKTMEIKN